MTGVVVAQIAYALVVSVAFMVAYAFRNWNATVMGRHIMWFTGAIAVELLSLLLLPLWQPPPVLLYVAVFGAVDFVVTQRLWLLLHTEDGAPTMNKVAKAITAAAIALGGAVGAAEAAGHGITGTQWVAIGVAAVVAGFGVWAVPNTPQEPTP